MAGRVVHLRKDPFDERIDRETVWGNLFVVGRDGFRGECVDKFENWVRTGTDHRASWIRDNVHTLDGKTLGCWCAPRGGIGVDDLRICHGQVLLKLAAESIDNEVRDHVR